MRRIAPFVLRTVHVSVVWAPYILRGCVMDRNVDGVKKVDSACGARHLKVPTTRGMWPMDVLTTGRDWELDSVLCLKSAPLLLAAVTVSRDSKEWRSRAHGVSMIQCRGWLTTVVVAAVVFALARIIPFAAKM